MNHPCRNCGAAVEDGRPFCPECRAPQIQVSVTPAPGSDPSIGLAGQYSPSIPQLPGFGHPLNLQRPTNRSIAARSALKAGLLGILLSIIPLIGIVLTGSLAVYFYRRAKGLAPSASLGARLGGAAGVIVSAINALFTIPVIVFHAQQESVDMIVETAQKFGFNTGSPQFQAAINNLFTPSGMLTSFLVALLLASLGGLLAAATMGGPRRH